MSEFMLMQNFNWATDKTASTRGQVVRTTSRAAPTKMPVPSVIFIPCQVVQSIDRWCPEGTLSDEALATSMNKKTLSPCRDEEEEFPQDSSVFATVSESKSTRSGMSQEDDMGSSSEEQPICPTRSKVQRRYLSQSTRKPRTSAPTTCRRSSMPPSLPRRKGSSAGLEL